MARTMLEPVGELPTLARACPCTEPLRDEDTCALCGLLLPDEVEKARPTLESLHLAPLKGKAK